MSPGAGLYLIRRSLPPIEISRSCIERNLPCFPRCKLHPLSGDADVQRRIEWMRMACTTLIWIKALSLTGNKLRSIAAVGELDGAPHLLVELLDHGADLLRLHPDARTSQDPQSAKASNP